MNRAAIFIISIIMFVITLITVIVIGAFGLQIIEPFSQAFGDTPDSLGWGDLGVSVVRFAVAGFFGLFLTLIVWFVYGPIRRDRRQQVGR